MSDLLGGEAERLRSQRLAVHRGELRERAPRVVFMAGYVASLPELHDRRLAMEAARDVAPDWVADIEREVRWMFERRRQTQFSTR